VNEHTPKDITGNEHKNPYEPKPIKKQPSRINPAFKRSIARVINRSNVDSELATPDYVLAEVIAETLRTLRNANDLTRRFKKGGGQ
jgi:hypothetical protein